jgi:hypothetical protein
MITVLRTELKLLLRNWGVWVVLAATLLLGLDVGRSHTMATLPLWIDESVFRFYLLGPLLLTVAAGRRARTDRVDELIGAMPYPVSRWVAGRYLANWLVWLTGALACWVVPIAVLVWRGEPVGLAPLALHYLAAAPVTVAATTAVGFALGHLPGTSFVGYLLGMGYYFVAVFGVMMSSPSGEKPWMFMDMLAPQRYLPLTATGYFPNTGLVLLNRAFDTALAAGLGALIMLLVARRRRLPAVLAGTALLLAVLTAVGSASVTLDQLVDRRTAQTEEARAMFLAAKATPPEAAPVQVDGYDLSVTFAPDSHGMSVSGSFVVTNPGPGEVSQIDLTLRANLAVEQVLDPAGAVPFQRAGNRLSVTRPLKSGESVKLSATWHGTVWHWRKYSPRNFEGWSLGAHVSRSSIFLPATYGWYPMAGNVALYWATGDERIFDLTPQQPVAAFALTTSGTNLSVISNAGDRAPGLFMVGTSLPTTSVDGVAFTVPRAKVQHAADLLDKLRVRAGLLGLTELPGRVIELPEGVDLGLEVATELRITPGAVLLHTQDAEWGTALDNVQLLSARWWNLFYTPADVRQGLGAYMEWAATGRKPDTWPNSTPIMETLIAADEAKGRDAALDLLRTLFARTPDGPKYEDVAATLHLPLPEGDGK